MLYPIHAVKTCLHHHLGDCTIKRTICTRIVLNIVQDICVAVIYRKLLPNGILTRMESAVLRLEYLVKGQDRIVRAVYRAFPCNLLLRHRGSKPERIFQGLRRKLAAPSGMSGRVHRTDIICMARSIIKIRMGEGRYIISRYRMNHTACYIALSVDRPVDKDLISCSICNLIPCKSDTCGCIHVITGAQCRNFEAVIKFCFVQLAIIYKAVDYKPLLVFLCIRFCELHIELAGNFHIRYHFGNLCFGLRSKRLDLRAFIIKVYVLSRFRLGRVKGLLAVHARRTPGQLSISIICRN